MASRHNRSPQQNISRRDFLGAGMAGGASMLAGGFGALSPTTTNAARPGDPVWIEKTIPELQSLLASGALSSVELTHGYIRRIADLNPLLRAVIEINPNASAIAAQLDTQRRRGRLLGPLHGIPILLKDNIATDDRMQTTAGSLALVNSKVASDAVVAARLRAAGAIILGKANLGEWANFRGFNPLGFFGWTARGGATHNPYLLSYTAFGSSSGSAVAAAANLCAAAIGTETDGSIVGPSNANHVVGLKPTLGLVSQAGIIPISHEQDTAGPMARTVTDVAVLLGVLQSPFGAVAGRPLPTDYTRFLRRGALAGKTIGIDRRFVDQYDVYGYPGDDDTLPYFEQALAMLSALGATLVDTDSGDVFNYFEDEFTALLIEFKPHLEEYLAGLTHTRMRTLGDLIAFNIAHCAAEMPFYGQELFEISESLGGDFSDPTYRRGAVRLAARAGIDNARGPNGERLDAIVAPHLSNSTAPAIAGYPNLALPVGITPAGKPAGMLMYSGFLKEPELIGFAYDLEQALQVRRQPQMLGSVNDPPNAGLCEGLRPSEVFRGKAHLPHGRFFG
ncbi:MAG TPA: amidase family protein [Casimicrobiaceae bacterium]|nr:amidase family protein [Casimicrobiaceae bacterium]